MLDVMPLLSAVDALADRLRALPQSALTRGAAAEGLALAREFVLRAQRLEEPGAEPRELPDAGPFAVGDQVAVSGHDLAYALRDTETARAEDVAQAVEEVRRTAARC
ncbi:hypothetical protein ABZ840_36505 [Streptomyces sp. NPDC047117]|uniref:hypothetical protein n=1 Tax=unclassified Streptomyces TaxID=2593676 RepID=UPI0034107ADB